MYSASIILKASLYDPHVIIIHLLLYNSYILITFTMHITDDSSLGHSGQNSRALLQSNFKYIISSIKPISVAR